MSAVSVRHAVANRRTFVAALTIGGLLMTGCSANSTTSTSASNATQSAASNEATTVTVMYAGNEFSKKDIAAFEQANPTIKVNFIEFDQTRLNAMLTAGDPPDLVRGNPSANLFARGLATPLDDFVKNSTVIKADDLESVNDAWRYDGKVRGQGKLYGIVKDWSPDLTIWQNQGVFDKAGVKPLSTTTPRPGKTSSRRARPSRTRASRIPSASSGSGVSPPSCRPRSFSRAAPTTTPTSPA